MPFLRWQNIVDSSYVINLLIFGLQKKQKKNFFSTFTETMPSANFEPDSVLILICAKIKNISRHCPFNCLKLIVPLPWMPVLRQDAVASRQAATVVNISSVLF